MRRSLVIGAALIATGIASCSWSRFDTVRSEPPVVLLDRANSVSAGFATSVTGTYQSSALLVGGEPEVASGVLWQLGSGDPPSAPAVSVCADLTTCRLIGTPVGVTHGNEPDCFVYGVGRAGVNDPGALFGSCGADAPFTLGVPASVATGVVDVELSATPAGVSFSGVLALSSNGQDLVAASPDQRIAWAYDTNGNVRTTFDPPADSDGTFGVAVATARVSGGEQVVAVSAPGQGKVYLYQFATPGAPINTACFQRNPPWGVVMTAATAGSRSALIVSDGASSVDVIDLTTVPASSACAPPTPIHTVSCVEDDDVTDCSIASFGYSVTVADVNGDGTLELAVGIPGAKVRGVEHAGAIEVFDLFGANDAPEDTLFVSSGQVGDRLGVSLGSARVEGRDVLAGGMPGASRQEVALFYCSKLPGVQSASPRCQ